MWFLPTNLRGYHCRMLNVLVYFSLRTSGSSIFFHWQQSVYFCAKATLFYMLSLYKEAKLVKLIPLIILYQNFSGYNFLSIFLYEHKKTCLNKIGFLLFAFKSYLLNIWIHDPLQSLYNLLLFIFVTCCFIFILFYSIKAFLYRKLPQTWYFLSYF